MLCDRMRDVVRARKHDGAYPTAKARRPRRSVRDRLDYQLLKGRSHPEHDRPKNVTRDFGINRPNDLSEAFLLVRLLRCPLLHDRPPRRLYCHKRALPPQREEAGLVSATSQRFSGTAVIQPAILKAHGVANLPFSSKYSRQRGSVRADLRSSGVSGESCRSGARLQFPTDLASFLDLIHQHGDAAYSLMFAYAASHSLLLALFAGYAAHSGALGFGTLIMVCWFGSFAGDVIRFWIGRRFGTRWLGSFPKL